MTTSGAALFAKYFGDSTIKEVLHAWIAATMAGERTTIEHVLELGGTEAEHDAAVSWALDQDIKQDKARLASLSPQERAQELENRRRLSAAYDIIIAAGRQRQRREATQQEEQDQE